MRQRSGALAVHLDGLAAALARAGAPPEPSSRLIELASLATMTAVALEHARAPAPPPARPEAPGRAPRAA